MCGGIAQRRGVLALSVWIEPEGGLLRARITARADVLQDEEETAEYAAGVEAVVRIVERWLEEFERAADVSR
jgi:hypothetical protein